MRNRTKSLLLFIGIIALFAMMQFGMASEETRSNQLWISGFDTVIEHLQANEKECWIVASSNILNRKLVNLADKVLEVDDFIEEIRKPELAPTVTTE